MITDFDRKTLVRLAAALPRGDKARRAIVAGLAKLAAPSYQDYLERKKKEGKKPLSKEDWEARLQGTGHAPGKEEHGEKPAKTFSKKYNAKVEQVMHEHKLTDDDADQIKAWKKDRPNVGKPISDAEKLRRFLAKAKPETRERMKGMSPADFVKILGAILDEDTGAA